VQPRDKMCYAALGETVHSSEQYEVLCIDKGSRLSCVKNYYKYAVLGSWKNHVRPPHNKQ
ncbi:hypothetical protein Hamer_G007205, partial [Homarus americanus]